MTVDLIFYLLVFAALLILMRQAERDGRETAIKECAELVRTWAQDNETVQPSFTSMTAAILALIPNEGKKS